MSASIKVLDLMFLYVFLVASFQVLRSMRNMEVWLERPLQAVVPLTFYKDRSSAILSQANKASSADANGADDAASPTNNQFNDYDDQNDYSPLVLSADAASTMAAPVDKVRRFVNSRLAPGASAVAYLAGPAANQVSCLRLPLVWLET